MIADMELANGRTAKMDRLPRLQPQQIGRLEPGGGSAAHAHPELDQLTAGLSHFAPWMLLLRDKSLTATDGMRAHFGLNFFGRSPLCVLIKAE